MTAPATAEPPKGYKIGGIVFLVLIIGGFFYLIVATALKANGPSSAPATKTYSVIGQGQANVTYANGQSGTNSEAVSLPWTSSPLVVHEGQDFTLAAVLAGSGSIECKIQGGGSVDADNTSNGAQATCGANWSAP